MFLPIVSPLRVRSCIPWTGPLKFPPIFVLTFEYAAEQLIMSAIENCATSVFLTHLPPLVKSDFDASALSPSLRQRFEVVDRRDKLWQAVRAYFQPIELDVRDVVEFSSHGITFRAISELTCLARDIHLLLVAARKHAQVEIDLVQRRDNLRALIEQHGQHFKPETRARLSLVMGILTALVADTPLDGLRARPGVENWVRERLDDILDDAYLAEASSLKRFIAYESNKAALRRDFRKILATIVRKRRWAREAFSLSTQLVALPTVAVNALGSFVEDIGLSAPIGPVVVSAKTIPLWTVVARSPTSGPIQYWRVPTQTLTDDAPDGFLSSFEPYEYEEVLA